MTSKEFIDTYMPLGTALYRVAFHLLESQADAEDAVQDLYIKLWNSRETLGTVKSPRAYCITLMKNICIDRIRKASRNRQAGLQENIPANGEADDRTIGKESIKQVAVAIRKLPKGQQEVLKLRTFEELSNEEIAQRTGMSNLTVRVLLSQARKTLRKAL
ncbi:MAG: sigma-70 family RNA polymerase sigma factor [Clostridium sp.]|nr:sigma-70 family RNA polymerase sigma factor [Bacteroides sp.]MCM1199226.1 sigma-70 family RNA polymerase sigma factor [Clostridium sp.]